MQIKEISISNFLSFRDPVVIDELGRINLFVGKNNEGKSNVLKVINLISLLFKNASFHGSHENGGDWVYLKMREDVLKSGFNLTFLEDLFYKKNSTNPIITSVTAEFSMETIAELVEDSEDQFSKAGNYPVSVFKKVFTNSGKVRTAFKFEGRLFRENNVILFCLDSITALTSKLEEEEIIFNLEKDKYFVPVQGGISALQQFSFSHYQRMNLNNEHINYLNLVIKIFFNFLKLFWKNNVWTIQTQREVLSKEQVQKLKNLRDGRRNQRLHFRKIKELLHKLIFLDEIQGSNLERDLELVPSLHKLDSSKKPQIDLIIKDDSLPIFHYGSGIAQLLFFAIEILSKPKGTLFLIEEPETNFHPALQRDFLHFIFDLENEGYQFFITTHSSILIDPVLNQVHGSVYHVYKKDREGTKFSQVEKIFDLKVRNALDSLGVKGSDLLQANGLIWVEGPSDRIYIKKWLELYWEKLDDKESTRFEEGLDFSFVFYGGSILSHFGASFDTENSEAFDDLIDIIPLNRNAVVVMDKDGGEADGKKWSNKERIQREIEDAGGSGWITDGKEIENYLPAKLINSVYKDKLKKNYSINSLQGFVELFKDKKIPTANKVKFAQKICNSMDISIFENKILLEKIEKLYNTIQKWNN